MFCSEPQEDVKNRTIQDTSIRWLNPLFHRHIMYDLLNTVHTAVTWKEFKRKNLNTFGEIVS